jgi:hypothetical protein
MSIEGEVQAKDIENIFNMIICRKYTNHEKEMDIQVQAAFRTTNQLDQKRTSPHHIRVKTFNIQNKKKDNESCKKDVPCHIKRQTQLILQYSKSKEWKNDIY